MATSLANTALQSPGPSSNLGPNRELGALPPTGREIADLVQKDRPLQPIHQRDKRSNLSQEWVRKYAGRLFVSPAARVMHELADVHFERRGQTLQRRQR